MTFVCSFVGPFSVVMSTGSLSLIIHKVPSLYPKLKWKPPFYYIHIFMEWWEKINFETVMNMIILI